MRQALAYYNNICNLRFDFRELRIKEYQRRHPNLPTD
jgi:hypothetical protein